MLRERESKKGFYNSLCNVKARDPVGSKNYMNHTTSPGYYRKLRNLSVL